MAEGKIEIKVGGVSFTGQGSENWLSSQLDKVLKNLPELVSAAPSSTESVPGDGGGVGAGKAKGSLAAFLQAKNAKTNQVRKFLATAQWILDTQNKKRVVTADVSSALNDHNQGKLGNPADCLAKNVSKGHCVKDGKKEFYVSDEGRTEIG